MSKKTFLSISFLFFALFTFAQRGSVLVASPAVTSQITEAKNFGLTLMSAYFNRDCNFVYGKLSSEIIVFDGGSRVNKSSFSAQDICNAVAIRSDINATYSSYLNSYEPEVLSATEFATKFPAYQTVLQLKEGDFYFGGNKLKTGGTEHFVSHNHTRFVLRRTGLNAFQVISF